MVDDATDDFERSFSIVFSNGDIVEDANNEIAFETSTTHYTKITCALIATKPTLAETAFFIWNPEDNPNGFLSILMEGNHHTEHDIATFTDNATIGAQTFGQTDSSTLYNHIGITPGDTNHGHVFRINSRTFDLTTNTGTIDCSYSYEDDNGVTISGVYVGDYEILTAF